MDQILVVTYTVAATGELRDRIRRRLAEARGRTSTGRPTDDQVVRRLPERSRGARGRRRAVSRKPCAASTRRRSSRSTGSASGCSPSAPSRAASPSPASCCRTSTTLLQEVVDDFWRRTVPGLSPLCIAYLMDQRVTPDTLLAAVRPHLGQAVSRRWPHPASARQTAAVEAAYAAAYRALRDALGGGPGRGRSAALGRRPPSRPGAIAPAKRRGWMAEHGRLPGAGRAAPRCRARPSSRFAPAHAGEGHQEGPAAPRPSDLRRLPGAGRRAGRPWSEVLDARRRRARGGLPRLRGRGADRRASGSASSTPTTDLLTELLRALEGPRGERLAGLIRQRYPAALIDEFQDTDPVQYDIFRRVYGGSRLPLLLVGDPKQAIYGFRGADVFTYLEARRSGGSEQHAGPELAVGSRR